MGKDDFIAWGWRIPFLLSLIVVIIGYFIRREVDETPAFAEESEEGAVPKAPIVQAFQTSWADMLRVVCMALMNVIPVVATIFGAAYAVQPAYGIGFKPDVYLWIPVLGNIAAVLRHPVCRQSLRQDRPAAADHLRRAVLRPAGLWLSLRDQHARTCRWRSCSPS